MLTLLCLSLVAITVPSSLLLKAGAATAEEYEKLQLRAEFIKDQGITCRRAQCDDEEGQREGEDEEDDAEKDEHEDLKDGDGEVEESEGVHDDNDEDEDGERRQALTGLNLVVRELALAEQIQRDSIEIEHAQEVDKKWTEWQTGQEDILRVERRGKVLPVLVPGSGDEVNSGTKSPSETRSSAVSEECNGIEEVEEDAESEVVHQEFGDMKLGEQAQTAGFVDLDWQEDLSQAEGQDNALVRSGAAAAAPPPAIG